MPKGKRTEKLIDRKRAVEFHTERRRVGDVIAWNVTREPDRFVARPKCAMPWAPALVLQATTLDDLRRKLPPGLCYFPGDGTTLEVWI